MRKVNAAGSPRLLETQLHSAYRGGSRIYEMGSKSGVKRGAVGAEIETPKASRSEPPKAVN